MTDPKQYFLSDLLPYDEKEAFEDRYYGRDEDAEDIDLENYYDGEE